MEEPRLPGVGLNNNQLFFLSYAHVRTHKYTDANYFVFQPGTALLLSCKGNVAVYCVQFWSSFCLNYLNLFLFMIKQLKQCKCLLTWKHLFDCFGNYLLCRFGFSQRNIINIFMCYNIICYICCVIKISITFVKCNTEVMMIITF